MKREKKFKFNASKPLLSKKKKEDIGLSPYAVVFRGEKRIENFSIRVMEFDLEEVREYEISSATEIRDLKKSDKLVWINIYGIHDTESLKMISGEFDIPNNILSDILNPSLRSKTEAFDDGILVTIKLIKYLENRDEINISNLSMILKDKMLITFQEENVGIFEPVRERIRKFSNKIRNSGSDYLAFALLDVVVDNYIYIMGVLGDIIEGIDEKLTYDPRKEWMDEINKYKRDINILRKNIFPAREMIFSLLKLESDLIQDFNLLHFRELQENIKEATELTDTYREMLFDQMSIYHTTVSSRLNDIMRILTIFSVIFIPLTFLVGVYGTNFDNLPELHLSYGYFAMWGVMITIAIVMLIYFKVKKWF